MGSKKYSRQSMVFIYMHHIHFSNIRSFHTIYVWMGSRAPPEWLSLMLSVKLKKKGKGCVWRGITKSDSRHWRRVNTLQQAQGQAGNHWCFHLLCLGTSCWWRVGLSWASVKSLKLKSSCATLTGSTTLTKRVDAFQMKSLLTDLWRIVIERKTS